MNYQNETVTICRDFLAKNPANKSRAGADLWNAIQFEHPALCILDSLLKMAKVHKEKFDAPISADSYCGRYWLECATACRALLSADHGAIDCGTLEAIFWRALELAEFSEADL